MWDQLGAQQKHQQERAERRATREAKQAEIQERKQKAKDHRERNIQQIFLSENGRQQVLREVKQYLKDEVNPESVPTTPSIPLPNHQRTAQGKSELVRSLREIGFMKEDCEWALAVCDAWRDRNTTEEALHSLIEFLLLFLDESRLPKSYQPCQSFERAGKEQLSEYPKLVEVLHRYGFCKQDATAALSACRGDFDGALDLVFRRLVHLVSGDAASQSPAVPADYDFFRIVQAEYEALAAIFGDDFVKDEHGNVALTVISHADASSHRPLQMKLLVSLKPYYPFTLPRFRLECDDLSRTQRLTALIYLIQRSLLLLGQPMLYELAMVLQENAPFAVSPIDIPSRLLPTSLPEGVAPQGDAGDSNRNSLGRLPRQRVLTTRLHAVPRLANDPDENETLFKEHLDRKSRASYKAHVQLRGKLPVMQHRQLILDAICRNRVVVIR